jgi:plastocyanin
MLRPYSKEDPMRAFGISVLATALLLAAAPALADVTVEVGHNHFKPTSVTIKKGESVTFHNVDEMPGGHTVAAEDGSFQSPPLAKGEDYTHKFETPGTVKLKILQHPNASGEVIVQ